MDSLRAVLADGKNRGLKGKALKDWVTGQLSKNDKDLITATDNVYIFEITNGHEIVWEYNFGSGNAFIARAQKYSTYYLNGFFSDYNMCLPGLCGNTKALYILIFF